MPLPTPDLDDLTFQQIVNEAKKLIPKYCPEWTNHNVSDPGVALIELFAWMSEMVLYRVNQVPDRLYTHFLNMVGVEQFPPTVATTDLTFYLTSVRPDDVVIEVGSEVATTASTGSLDPTIVFRTTERLTISPPDLRLMVAVSDKGRTTTDVSEDVKHATGGAVCFQSAELTPDDTFCLGFAGSLAGVVLRLDLEAEAVGQGIKPDEPPLVWEVWNGEGWRACKVHEDTTGGLNKAGSLVLLVPNEHQRFTINNESAYWLRARLLKAPVGRQYAASPRVRGIVASAIGGTVLAEHAEKFQGETLGRSDGTPGQAFALTRSPLLPRDVDEYVVVEDGSDDTQWTKVADFAGSTVHDKHVVWDDSTGSVHFGPRVRDRAGAWSQHGAVPTSGAIVKVTGYRVGGGPRGNVAAETLTLMRSNHTYVASVRNLGAAQGGVDAETLEQAKVRGPLSLRTGDRAVTAGDYERLTLESSGQVARVRCLDAGRGNGAVTLLVVPQVLKPVTEQAIDDYAITDSLLTTISSHLDERRVIGTAVEVRGPWFQGVSIAALVHARPGRPTPVVQQRAREALSRFVNPLVGGPYGTGWPFGTNLNVASVVELLERVEGVDRVDEALLFDTDLRTGHRSGSAKDVIRISDNTLFLATKLQVVVR